jgi:hypothetical protein
VGHAFKAPGVHHVTLTVSDAVGRHGQAIATLTVYLTPVISKLKVALKPGGKPSVSYRDTVAAKTTLTLKHRGTTVRSLHHADRRGRNTTSFSTHGLSPGRYVLVAVARNAAGGKSRAARVSFTIS